MDNTITRFINRLSRAGISVELVANYPWIYIEKVNGVRVKEKFCGNHGFTAFFMNKNITWTDRREVFKLIRRYIAK